MNAPTALVRIDFGSGKGFFEVNDDNALPSLLGLMERRYDARTWAMLRLVLSYDAEDSCERENIERTLLELLRNEPVAGLNTPEEAK